MVRFCLALMLLVVVGGATGCEGEPEPVTGEDLETQLEEHREMTNREMQDIKGE